MTLDERKKLVECATRKLKGRGKTIVHVGAVRTEDAVELAQHAAEAGADAISAIPPVFFGTTFDAVCQHYEKIAAATSLPFLIYTIPGRSGINFTIDQFKIMSQIDGVAGIKFTSHELFLLNRIVQHFGDDFLVLNGADELLIAGLLMGAHGGIGTTYNIFPKHYRRIFEYSRTGEYAKARDIQFALDRYIGAGLTAGGMGAFKKTMRWLGFDCGLARGPVMNIDDDKLSEVKAVFEEVNQLVS